MLTDFGLSRAAVYSQSLFEEKRSTCGFIGTTAWTAYEILKALDDVDDSSDDEGLDVEIKPTCESDMWSFGMVVFVSPSIMHE